MKNVWILFFGLSFCFFCFVMHASKEVGCLCKDGTVQYPDCGICGSDMGVMEKADTGIHCICENKLFTKEISCEETCKHNKGWSEKFN